MIEEIQELLRKIDLIVDSESRRLNDEIEELRSQLKEFKDTQENFSSIRDEIKNLTSQIDELTYERDQLKQRVKKLSPLEEKTKNQEEKITELLLELEGYTFTTKVISSWIPSQKENIDVLVALSSSPNHESTFEKLQEKTTIPAVTLKNRVIPLLKESSLVSVKKDTVKLTMKEIKE